MSSNLVYSDNSLFYGFFGIVITQTNEIQISKDLIRCMQCGGYKIYMGGKSIALTNFFTLLHSIKPKKILNIKDNFYILGEKIESTAITPTTTSSTLICIMRISAINNFSQDCQYVKHISKFQNIKDILSVYEKVSILTFDNKLYYTLYTSIKDYRHFNNIKFIRFSANKYLILNDDFTMEILNLKNNNRMLTPTENTVRNINKLLSKDKPIIDIYINFYENFDYILILYEDNSISFYRFNNISNLYETSDKLKIIEKTDGIACTLSIESNTTLTTEILTVRFNDKIFISKVLNMYANTLITCTQNPNSILFKLSSACIDIIFNSFDIMEYEYLYINSVIAIVIMNDGLIKIFKNIDKTYTEINDSFDSFGRVCYVKLENTHLINHYI